METYQFEHFNAFRKFIDVNASGEEAVHEIEPVRPIYRKALYGPFDLSPPAEIDAAGLSSAITVATDLEVNDLVIVSSSGLYPDLGRTEELGDMLQVLYQALLGRNNAGRLSWHVADRHGHASRRFLAKDVLNRLDLTIRYGGLARGLKANIRSGYGGALNNRLDRAVGIDASVNHGVAEALIDGFCYTVHACIFPFLCYALAGIEEGTYSLMPLIESLGQALPLSEVAGRPGTWLVLGA